MKLFLNRCKRTGLLAVLLLVLVIQPVVAAESYSDLYIAIGEAIMSTKQGQDFETEKALAEFKASWMDMKPSELTEAREVEQMLKVAVDAQNDEERLKALTALSKSLHHLEKAENPVDELAERAKFTKAIQPALDDFKVAIQSADRQAMQDANKRFIASWTKNERPVREQDIAAYGKIETQTAFIRITLAADDIDQNALKQQFIDLQTAITDFSNGKKVAKTQGDYSLASLIELLETSKQQVQANQYKEAAGSLRNFITTWPNVEGEIRTKNASLYQKIENDLPLLVSELSKTKIDDQKIISQLYDFKQQIALLQGDTSYSFWDSALILLREGLEALLIIIGLVAFLKRADQEHAKRWVYIGAVLGIFVSAAAAILMSTIFQSVTIGMNRERMEGYIGLLAAALMIGVGIWLHSKSTVLSWNQYISKRLDHAISKQSVWAMAFISFLAVFREGAETIVFYAGIAPKMSTAEFTAGIALAFGILVVVAIVLLRMTGRIPIHRFFAVATFFIYILAFKIIGVSIHTLQLTNVIPTHAVSGLPIVNLIGFYPTTETMIGQAILVVLVIGTILYKRKQEKAILI